MNISSWVPDRKVVVGGLGSIAAWGLLKGLSVLTGIDIGAYLQPLVDALCSGLLACPVSPDATAVLGLLLGWGASYLLPPSTQDVLRRVNAELVAKAVADPEHPLTQEAIDAAKKE